MILKEFSLLQYLKSQIHVHVNKLHVDISK